MGIVEISKLRLNSLFGGKTEDMMDMRRLCMFVALGAVLLVLSSPALAQSTDAGALMDRIERLERDIRTLNVQIARGGSAAPSGESTNLSAGGTEPAYARLSVRMSQLENDLRGVTGRIEEMSFQMQQVSKQLETLVADVDFRLSQLEHGSAPGGMQKPQASANAPMTQPMQSPANTLNAMPQNGATPAAQNSLPDGTQVLGQLRQSDLDKTANAAPAPQSEADALLAQLTGEPATPAPDTGPATKPLTAPAPGSVSVAENQQSALAAPNQTASLPDATPRDKYMNAFGLLRQGKYDQASSALRQFIEQHGDDPLASNARYWLGETYYVRGSFVEAAETFLEGYQTDPQGPKAPDALLKLGMSLSSLDKKSEACAAFQKLRGDFPDAPAGLKSTLQREWQKNGCV